MTWAIVLDLFKRFWWTIPLAVFLFWGYHTIYERGAHSRDNEVVALKADAKKWHDAYNAQQATLDNERTAHDKAIGELKVDQGIIIQDLTKRLDSANRQKKQTAVTVATITERITPAVNAAFPLPNVFVRLHDAALGAEGTAEGAAVPGGGPADDGAASAIAVSRASAIIASNYAECTARGEVVKAWQDWYPKMKAAWVKATATQANFKVVTP